MKEYKYKAFISYRHLEPDMQAAERLQKLLENYKPPKNLVSKKENWRIFRDVSELQSSSDLSEDIRNAIEDSEFLIVICSPAYNESKWCMQELTRFRELHNDTNENIITLLVSGEPDQAFPELLRFRDVKSVDENGRETSVKVEVEPLAANIKADTLKESMKKLNTEYLRIAAPLIGCDFNDLYQREKKREAQRRMRIFGGATGVLSVITVISAVSAITISKKNSEIKDKNSKIEEQYGQIEEQYAQIEKQYGELLVENAEHLAAESEVLYSSGSLIPAIKKAVSALPSKEGEKPVIPEAEYALSREMSAFEPDTMLPRYALRHESAIEQLSYMGEGKTIVSTDASGIYFWSAENGSLIKKITPADGEFASEKYGSSNVLKAFIQPDTDKTGTVFSYIGIPGKVSYNTGIIFDAIYTGYAHSLSDDEPGTGGDVFVYNSDGTVWRLSGETGDVIWKTEPNAESFACRTVIADPEHLLRVYNDRRALSDGSYIAGDKTIIEVIDKETGKISGDADISGLSSTIYSFESETEIKLVKDGILYVYNQNPGSADNSKILAYEIKEHQAVPCGSLEFAKLQSGAVRKAGIWSAGDSIIASSCDVISSGGKTVITRNESKLGEPVWSTNIDEVVRPEDKVFLFKAADIGSENDVLAVVGKLYFSLIDFKTGKVIKTIEPSSRIVDVSFSQRGLIMFTVADGEEYAVSVKSYVSDKPKYSAYVINQFITPVALSSYSRDRYVTAEEYSNTAYIQFMKISPSYTPIDTGLNRPTVRVAAVSSDGVYALVSADEYPEGSDKAVQHIYIYNTDSSSLTEVEALKGCSSDSAAFMEGNKIAAKISDSTGKKKIVIIDAADGTVSDTQNTDSLTVPGIKFLPCADGVCYVSSGGKDIIKLSPDGSVSSWKTNEKSAVNGIYAVIDDKAAVYAENSSNKKRYIEICDFGSNSLHVDRELPEGVDVLCISDLGNGSAVALLSSRTALIFDAGTGAVKAELKLSGASQEPVSAVSLGNGKFAVLCRDSKLYEADENGFTGNVTDLGDTASGNIRISEADGSSAALLRTSPSAEDNCVFVIWNDHQAWLIDTEQFKVRYRIDSFAGAPSGKDIVFVYDSSERKAGFFPVYTAQQLMSAAKDYLSDLGENVEDIR